LLCGTPSLRSSPGGSQLKHNGGPGYAKTVTVFVPKCARQESTKKTLHGILVDNPRRLLSLCKRTIQVFGSTLA
jgi:hypothetical protein